MELDKKKILLPDDFDRLENATAIRPALLQNEQAALLSVLSGGKLDRQRSAQLLRLVNGRNVKRLIFGGIALSVGAQAVINYTREQRMRHVVAKEITKQLSPLHAELRQLEDEVDALSKDVKSLRKELKR